MALLSAAARRVCGEKRAPPLLRPTPRGLHKMLGMHPRLVRFFWTTEFRPQKQPETNEKK